MAKLYLLHEGASASAYERSEIVHKACLRAGVDFLALDSLAADYTRLPDLQPGDMLFNCGRGSTHLETLLTRPHTATFRTQRPQAVSNGYDTTIYSALLDRRGLPSPKTLYRLPNDKEKLKDCADWLGGFPIVVKIVGGTVGVGTMIVESLRSLRSLVDYLHTTRDEFILRQYIEPKHVARVCVLGEEIVASLKYAIHPDDFRGLAYRDGGIRVDFGHYVNDLARDASRACEYEFTGVDIIIDHNDQAYILEVNPPSNFVAFERDLNIPIGDKLVSYLSNKALILSENAEMLKAGTS